MILTVLLTSGGICEASTVKETSGSAIVSEGTSDNAYLQEEFEDASTKDFLRIYSIGVLSGFGLTTIVYIIGIGAGSFGSILKDAN